MPNAPAAPATITADFFQTAVESANDAILITEAPLELPGPRIEYVNAAFTRMTGYSLEEIVGQTPRILQGPKTDRGLLDHLRQDLLTGESFHGETVNYRKDGSEYVVEWRITPLHDAAGKLVKWVAIQRDVTNRVLAQQAREMIFKAEQAARVEGERISRLKDEFLATLSHELRTPLNAILGWTGILKEADVATEPQEVAQAVEVIERNARTQVKLIEDLLDVSRIVSGNMRLEVESIVLDDIVEEAIQSVDHAARAKEITIHQSGSQKVTSLFGDHARLRQVFWNLLSNAIKFTPKGGRIEVSQHHGGSDVEVNVQDSGQGIADEFLPYVFDRFRQMDGSTSRRHGGMGLGLSIVKQLVELHGGTVRVVSAGTGKGSVFTVSLPLGRRDTARQSLDGASSHGAPSLTPSRVEREGAASPLPQPSVRTNKPVPVRGDALAGLRLLVVEDEADQRLLLRRLLEAQGATVSLAADANEGLERVREERPDVLISDIGMPGMDGYEFLRQVRQLPSEEGGRTPAIALSAFVRPQDRQRSWQAEFLTHITKPLEAEELLSVLANVAGLVK